MMNTTDSAPLGCEWKILGSQHNQHEVLVDKLTGLSVDTRPYRMVSKPKAPVVVGKQTPEYLQELTFKHKLNFHQHAAIKEIVAGNLQEALAILQEAKALLDELPKTQE